MGIASEARQTVSVAFVSQIEPADPVASMHPFSEVNRCRNAGRALVGAVVVALCGLPALAAAADPSKVLRVVFSIAETSFDPQFASDAASDSIIENIYEAMLDYDYLARPLQLVPRTLERCRRCTTTEPRTFSS